MAITTTADLLDAIIQNGLLDAREAAELPALCRRCPDLPSLTTELRTRGWLTEYQLDRLLQGEASQLVLGSYVLLEPIGQGGMGQVFKARHQLMHRLVALKLIRPELLSHPLAVARFRQEIQLVAQLQHPNIVLAHDAQQHCDRHFLVMEYCAGPNLRQVVQANGPLPVGLCCDLVRQVALGLQHAHEHGLIHRDIKPDNLLLLGATVKILDFGLARLLVQSGGADSPFSQAGLLCGTPDFVAPEQATDPRQADIRADLYSLGCTFYFLLTGLAPFPGGTAVEKILKHRLSEPVPLALHRAEVPASVCAIVERLMRKDPAQRFQTPGELAAVLESLGLPLEPLPCAIVPRTRMNEPIPSLDAATIGAPSLPVAGPPRMQLSATTIDTPTFQKPRAGRSYRALAFVVSLILVSGLVVGAVGLLTGWPGSTSSPPIHVSNRIDPKPVDPASHDPSTWWLLHTLRPHPNLPLSVAFSHDSKLLAVGCGNWPGNGAGGCIKVWDLATGTERVKLDDTRDGFCVAFSADGKMLAASHWDHNARDGNAEITVWDTAKWTRQATLPVASRRITCLAFRPDSKWLAVAGDQKQLSFWNFSGPRARMLDDRAPQDRVVTAVSYSPNGTVLASAGRDKPVHLFSVPEGYKVIKTLPLPATRDGTWLAFSPDGKKLAAVTSNEIFGAALRVWELDGYQLLRSEQHPRNFSGCAFTSDGSRLITGDTQTLLCWTVDEANPPVTVADTPGGFCNVAVSPDGSLLAASQAGDRSVKVWRIRKPE